MLRTIGIGIFIVGYAFYIAISAIADDSCKYGTKPILSAHDALESAIDYLGIFQIPQDDKILDTDSHVSKIVIEDTTTEFLRDYVAHRPAWLVRFDNKTLDLARASSEIEGRYPKSFAVIIDSLCGSLLAIISVPRERMNEGAIFSHVSESSKSLGPFGKRYFGFPMYDTLLNFQQALDSCHCHPLIAENIYAVLVTYKYEHNSLPQGKEYAEPFPAWVIFLDKMPPWQSPSGVEYSNQRVVLDARNGKIVGGVSMYGNSAK